MQTIFVQLILHLVSNSSALWLLIGVAILIAVQQLSNIIVLFLAVLSDKVNARMVRLLRATKKGTSKR